MLPSVWVGRGIYAWTRHDSVRGGWKLVWVLAGIVLFDVAIVVVLGLRAEVARRRDRREVRELERLYEAPPASSPTTMQGSAGVGFLGRHVAIDVHGARRVSIVRSPSFVLVIASISAVIVAALLSTADRVATRGDSVPTRSCEGRFWDRGSLRASHRTRSLTPSPRLLQERSRTARRSRRSGATASSSSERSRCRDGGRAHLRDVDPLLHWSAVAVATGYRIDRSVEDQASGSGAWVTIATTSSSVSTRDTHLEASTTYSYRVTALLEDGEAPASDVVTATTAPPRRRC